MIGRLPKLAAFIAFILAVTGSSNAIADEFRIANYPALQNGVTVGGMINATDVTMNTVLEPDEWRLFYMFCHPASKCPA